MPDATNGFQLPDDPREIMILLDTLRFRVLAFTELLDITDDEAKMLRTDHAALTDAVRATEAAEALAMEWGEFQTRLLQGTESDIAPPKTAIIPPITGSIGNVVREVRLARHPPMHAGIAGRLQRFVDRIIAHPNTTDQTMFDLGLLPGATIGFSPGQPRREERT